MSGLSACVCSITATQRRRFLWAAWWTEPPCETPFRAPDACNGGATSFEDALAEAERVAGRHLVVIAPYWARAWTRVMRGEPPPPRASAGRPSRRPPDPSARSLLRLSPGASIEDVKRAYRIRARATHPDHGGDPEQFRLVQRAYERLIGERRKRR